MTLVTFDLLELQEYANVIKESIFDMLEKDGHIESAQALKTTYVIVIRRKGVLGRAIDKLLGPLGDNTFGMVITAILPLKGNKEQQ